MRREACFKKDKGESCSSHSQLRHSPATCGSARRFIGAQVWLKSAGFPLPVFHFVSNCDGRPSKVPAPPYCASRMLRPSPIPF
jgi:hypothetical protein